MSCRRRSLREGEYAPPIRRDRQGRRVGTRRCGFGCRRGVGSEQMTRGEGTWVRRGRDRRSGSRATAVPPHGTCSPLGAHQDPRCQWVFCRGIQTAEIGQGGCARAMGPPRLRPTLSVPLPPGEHRLRPACRWEQGPGSCERVCIAVPWLFRGVGASWEHGRDIGSYRASAKASCRCGRDVVDRLRAVTARERHRIRYDLDSRLDRHWPDPDDRQRDGLDGNVRPRHDREHHHRDRGRHIEHNIEWERRHDRRHRSILHPDDGRSSARARVVRYISPGLPARPEMFRLLWSPSRLGLGPPMCAGRG